MNQMLSRLQRSCGCGQRLLVLVSERCQSDKLSMFYVRRSLQTRHHFAKHFHPLLRRYFCTAVTHSSDSVASLNFDTVIHPELDVDQRFKDISMLEENVRRRKLNVDVKKLHADYCQLMRLEQEKLSLEQQRRENADVMKHVVKEKQGEQLEVEKAELIRRGKIIRTKLKQLQDVEYQRLQKRVAAEILRLPVDLQRATVEEDTVVAEFGSKPEFSSKPFNHLTLGKNMRLIDSRQTIGNTFYLLKEAALLEHHLLHQVVGNYLRQSGLQHIVCPDMVKAFVTEGCGFDLSEMFEVAGKTSEDRSGAMESLGTSGDHSLVLAGVSSLGFAAYLSAMNIRSSSLPLKYYSVGRNYSPVVDEQVGLYSASQANCAAVFGVALSPDGAEEIFDEFSSLALSLYKSLKLPFRVVQVGASNLRLMESKREDFHIWSAGFNRYFKSGEVRLCRDYISRRLSIRSAENDLGEDKDSSNKFVHTVDGIVLRVPAIIAALMEHLQMKDGTCSLPPKFM